MPVLYLTVGKDSGSMLDIAAAFDQIGSNPVLWGSTIAFVFCIGAFNYFGLNITR